ncbi:serine/threonine protein phosphatase [Sphingomonas sanguinis]|uniref:serine/threonine protein phosphatase n=1 Tax=Sphingomonas sp. LC-1 TaxID=3110957 RepID=UPI0021BA8A69|nr:serine/threonine protein phosphatase [Sphingomonas sp. LC-1]MCT8001981.1 serine/threonine protein phosphatase [Sphingomonas sp. LC-1]
MRLRTLLAAFALSTAMPVFAQHAKNDSFSIAVIPDTQNYTDFEHQTEAGFPFDARELFYQQMAYIARNARSQGGDIVFATAVGDIWQHATERMDADHAARGLRAIPNPIVERHLAPSPRTLTVEMPIARKGFGILDGKLPFSVVPGNHDYDANWSDSRYAPAPDLAHVGNNPFPFGQLHYGGLKNWTSVFGARASFFSGKPWYVGSFNGGVDSAQLFEGGGYRFLHLGLEMAPDDATIAWAESMIRAHPGLPTIITIHDFLNPNAERKPIPAIDFKLVDPGHHNNAEDLWDKFIATHDQIFLVLSGHQNGQARRIDRNRSGHPVIQLLADYQDRRRTLDTASGQTVSGSMLGVGIGDGWMRLLRFDLASDRPSLTVRTFSTHYGATATQLPTYSASYKKDEKPRLSDAAFIDQEDFAIPLDGFRERFGSPR